MRLRSLNFLLNSRYKLFKNIYYFYNIYLRNFKFLKKSSQFDEDSFIQKYFKNYGIGKYLDLGCFHPVRDNNTYQLYKRNWNGINIDLNPLTIELFNFSRPKDINLNYALSNKAGKKNFYFMGDFSPLNTLDSNQLNFLKRSFNINKNQYKTKKIKVENINDILRKKKLNKIDFLNIDLEGYEYEVLKSFDFKRNQINLICIEFLLQNSLSMKKSEKIKKLFKKNNFKFIYKTGVNHFYKNTRWNYQ